MILGRKKFEKENMVGFRDWYRFLFSVGYVLIILKFFILGLRSCRDKFCFGWGIK